MDNDVNTKVSTTEPESRAFAALADFVERAAKGKTTSEAETEILPEVAKIVLTQRRISRI